MLQDEGYAISKPYRILPIVSFDILLGYGTLYLQEEKEYGKTDLKAISIGGMRLVAENVFCD